jgi:hypothetical protein
MELLIRILVDVAYIQLIEDRSQWRALLETV